MQLFLWLLVTVAGFNQADVPPQTQPRRVFQYPSGNSSLTTMSTDGKLVLVSGQSSRIGVYQTRTGLLLRDYRHHQSLVTDLAFMPGKTDTLLSADADGSVRVWNARTLTTYYRWQAPAPVRFVRGQPGGGSILVATRTAIWLWDMITQKKQRLTIPNNAPISSVAFDPKGTQLAVGYENGTVSVHDLTTGSTQSKKLHEGAIRAVWLGRDSVLTAGGEPAIKLWQPGNPQPVQDFTFTHPVETMTFDPVRKTVAVGFDTGEVAVHRLATQEALFTGKSTGKPRFLQFCADKSSLLLTGYLGSPAKTWLMP